MRLLLMICTVVELSAEVWQRNVIASAFRTNTALAADFTGDSQIDVIANEGTTREDVLFVAPDWNRVVLHKGANGIHSAVLDMDGDGDLDYVGAQYSPGLIYWLEQPARGSSDPWRYHVVDDFKQGGVNGIHGLMTGDVNRDGRPDLIANSAQPNGAFPNSLVWFAAPKWTRHIFADRDAPGLSHYLGFGDVNGDGRPDLASAAKVPEGGNWFAWWEQPAAGAKPWRKHVIATNHEGATNILMADVNRDGKTDFIATRGHGKGVLWFEAPSWKMHEIEPALEGPHSLDIGDIDGDGDIDAATCAKDSKLAAWFENDGRGRFTTHRIGENQAAYDVRLVDMDRDGDLDLLVAGQESRNVVWFSNPRTPKRR